MCPAGGGAAAPDEAAGGAAGADGAIGADGATGADGAALPDGATGTAVCGNGAGEAAGVNPPLANSGAPPIAPPIIGAGAAITVYIRPSAPMICCGTATGAGAITITGPPELTPASGAPANHCPTDDAQDMSAKTRTMIPTMMPGIIVGGLKL